MALLGLAFAAPAAAQLPVADLRASHTVLTEVPTLRFNDWPPLAPGYPQVVRLRIENFGPADVPDAGAAGSASGFLRPDLVLMSVAPGCGITLTVGTNYSLQWAIGLLRAGEFRECDLTLTATGAGPSTPPPNGPGRLAMVPTSSLVQSPFLRFGGTNRNFTIAPAVAVLADFSVRIEPTPVWVAPGTSRDVSIFITNRGPQALPAQQWPFYGWLERYNLFGPNPEQRDPFILGGPVVPGCRFQQIGPIISPPAFVELTAIVDGIAPGATQECRLRVEARPNATGERTLLFTQRILFDGVVDPNLDDNVAALRMIFTNPLPVPSTRASLLAALTILLALIGVGALAGPHRD